MSIGTIIVAGFLFFFFKFYYPEKSINLEGFTISSSWMSIIAIVYLILGITGAIFVNNGLKNQNQKLSREFFEISDDKIYLNKYDSQKSFSLSDVLNYENLINSNKNIVGIKINFKNGEKIELFQYDRKEVESVLNKTNIPKK